MIRFFVLSILFVAVAHSTAWSAIVTSTPPVIGSTNSASVSITNETGSWRRKINNSVSAFTKDSAAAIQAAVALVNLVFVVWVFMRETGEQRKAREIQDAANAAAREREVGVFWIQELVLRPNLELLHRFFSKYESQLAAVREQSVAGKSIEDLQTGAAATISEFKRDYHQIQDRIVEPLTTVHVEFRDLLPLMRRVEDLVTENVQRLPGCNLSSGQVDLPDVALRKLGTEFMTVIFAGQQKFVCRSPL
jgi:hypothetical protein